MEVPGQAARAVARRDEGIGRHVAILREDEDGRLEVLDETDGTSTALLAGSRLVDHVAEGDRPALLATQQAARAGRGQQSCQVQLATPDGDVRAYEVRYVPGVVDGQLVLLRDVDDLLRVAREAEVLRRVTELANAVTDLDEAVLGAVADLRETLGWRAGRRLRLVAGALEQSGGWSVHASAEGLPDIVDGVAPAGTPVADLAVTQLTPVASAAGDESVPAVLRDAGVIAVVAVPVHVGGEVTQVLEFFSGNTASVDEEQLELLARVGRQLAAVAVREQWLAELERSRDELARSNAELERFAYVASHDLQEPLRKIIGFSELLEDHHEPLDDAEAEYRSYVLESAQRLRRLIKDLLAYSRAGRRDMATGPVDLGVVAGQVLEDLSMAIDDAGATVRVDELPVVHGDDGQLREVVQNLVGNALKYRSEDRPCRIVITTDEAGTATAATAGIAVIDNGIGIDPDLRADVFEVFRRLHPAHAYGGTGLGLAMVERIVSRHGGTVRIDDSPLGHGVAVHLTFPTVQETS